MANEPKNAQLTLLYDGKTFVLDDFPADKLDDLKSIAKTLTQPGIENALANHPEEWEQFAAYVTGKCLEEVKRHYVDLIDDVNHIESGYVPLPAYNELRTVKKGTETSRTVQERRKVIHWTEAEHRLFLQGLENHGWGDWQSISRNCVVTRTPTQVASHAQKYKIRQNSKEKNKERKRSSIHDVTHVKNDDISAPQGPITSQTSGSAASSSGQTAEQAPTSPPAGIYAAPRIEQPIGGPLVSAVGTKVNLTAAGQSPEQAPTTPPVGIYAAPRIENPIGRPLVSAVGTPVNLSAAGKSAKQAPPTSPAGIYAARKIEYPIGGHLVSAVGTPVNVSAAGQSAEQAPPTGIYAAPKDRALYWRIPCICSWHSSESYCCWTHGL
ncbi:transcription factor DIVARICATA-like protein [Trifolium pratense]|uniref:Transcription factor DIVARICATA-like protein n=1 Tax=Trifolium pratense TaxID=57577 RepID=A0A2K3NF02_TRIPR|nr:transcription factor SRM1-like [Trifolium pratense]PNY01628.1 transcription factor DIVARICATA-like protein [Trifolium pratense]